jgi:hypothetical protein
LEISEFLFQGGLIMNGFELKERLLMAESESLCPECGARMVEENRLCEDEIVFIWYRCGVESCSGQWLRRLFAKELRQMEDQMLNI